MLLLETSIHAIYIRPYPFSYHYLFIIFLSSFFWYRLFSSLSRNNELAPTRGNARAREAERERGRGRGKKESIIPLGLILSLSAENTSCFCIYTHIYINQKISQCSRAVFFPFFFFLLYWPNLDSTLFYFPDFFLFLRTRIECAYKYKKKSSVVHIYIYEEHCTILDSVVSIFSSMFKTKHHQRVSRNIFFRKFTTPYF